MNGAKNANQDPFWERAEKMFLESIFLYVWMECPKNEYDEEGDFYTCKYNQKLVVDHIRHSKSKTGYVSEKTIYKCENCDGCPHKSRCIKGNNCKTPLKTA